MAPWVLAISLFRFVLAVSASAQIIKAAETMCIFPYKVVWYSIDMLLSLSVQVVLLYTSRIVI